LRAINVTETGIVKFGEMLKSNTGLRHVTLAWVQFGDDGARAISGGLLENTTLESLDFYETKMTPQGQALLQKAEKKNINVKIRWRF